MKQILFTYFKNWKLKVLTQYDNKGFHENLVQNGWKHTNTLNSVTFIEYLFNDCNDIDRAGEIQKLALT